MDTPQAAPKKIDSNAVLEKQIRAYDRKISEYTKAIEKLDKELETLISGGTGYSSFKNLTWNSECHLAISIMRVGVDCCSINRNWFMDLFYSDSMVFCNV